ncbi:hypothetical protein LOTGIDRAFT_160244 [Lottia gigantea]|uniref:Protein tweety homolog n=1 Tax=Lottia gigantea TaxID=225164 RepID=V3ZVZ9_LOTGI|nr:hypothetical protein LOTGIDRAFT_160244 [Lottia gigantea]ESO95693.1 hypothetical protein LOTGIDRAFT_160244 [Lottia gigantea]
MIWEILSILASLCFQGYEAQFDNDHDVSDSSPSRYIGVFAGIFGGTFILFILLQIIIICCCSKCNARKERVAAPDRSDNVSYISGQEMATYPRPRAYVPPSTGFEPPSMGFGLHPTGYLAPSTGFGLQPTGFDLCNDQGPGISEQSYKNRQAIPASY